MLPGNSDEESLRAGANAVDYKTVIDRSAWHAVAKPGCGGYVRIPDRPFTNESP